MPDWTYYFVKEEKVFFDKSVPPTILRISKDENRLEIYAGPSLKLSEALFEQSHRYHYKPISRDQADKFKARYSGHK